MDVRAPGARLPVRQAKKNRAKLTKELCPNTGVRKPNTSEQMPPITER